MQHKDETKEIKLLKLDNKEIFEKIINYNNNSIDRVYTILELGKSPIPDNNSSIYSTLDGKVGILSIMRNYPGSDLISLQNFADKNNISQCSMIQFNHDFGVPYNDLEDLRNIYYYIDNDIPPFDENDVTNLIGKEDAYRSLFSPDYYVIKSYDLILNKKVAVFIFEDGSRMYYTRTLPQDIYKGFKAKKVSELSKKLGIKGAYEYIINNQDV